MWTHLYVSKYSDTVRGRTEYGFSLYAVQREYRQVEVTNGLGLPRSNEGGAEFLASSTELWKVYLSGDELFVYICIPHGCSRGALLLIKRKFLSHFLGRECVPFLPNRRCKICAFVKLGLHFAEVNRPSRSVRMGNRTCMHHQLE
jgi:hypothetical protein